MKGDFFYSKSTGLHVSRKPLTMDSRVNDAADRAGIRYDWDDEGRINYIEFGDGKKLLKALDSTMLTPVQYWEVLKDATEKGDDDMVNELVSNRYTEWLNRVYFFKEGGDEEEMGRRSIAYIDNPDVVGKYEYSGKRRESWSPLGTPGWFNPEGNINEQTGEPIYVELNREKFATSWKYWSPDIGLSATPTNASAPIRGYVTSVGKPSYDMGIPVNCRYPKLMLRECRSEPLTPVIDVEILEQAESAIESNDRKAVIDFVKQYGRLFAESKDSLVHKIREQLFDMLGDASFSYSISEAASELYSGYEGQLMYDDFAGFVSNRKQGLGRALEENKDIVFVMGHKNPDSDTVVSSLFEAWRNHLIDGDSVVYVPIVQSERMPDEVEQLLGELSSYILFTNDTLYAQARQSGLARWLSVDQNREPEVQKYFNTIIDHHIVSEEARNRDIPKTLEMLGSCSALVARKYLGMGLEFSEELARTLYGAALMDTENRVEHKMTAKDVMIMDYLKGVAGIESDNDFYRDLMSYLLDTDDVDMLFKRDYKEDWGFGFSVAKVKNVFSDTGEVLKLHIISRMYKMAAQNNVEKNFPLTLMKIADYKGDNETVNRERIYLVFNKNASPKFKDATQKLLESIIKFEFPDNEVYVARDYIDFWGTGVQLSRKKTAPVLEPVVKAFNSYFYSPSIDRWVKRDFLKNTGNVQAVVSGLSTDAHNRITHINYLEAKELTERLGIGMLSLNEYWKVLEDAKSISDVEMVESLQGSNFVEFLDSAIVDNSVLIDHPDICLRPDVKEIHYEQHIDPESQEIQLKIAHNYIISGKQRTVDVLRGKPGLIHPSDIDMNTGIPKIVQSPNQYDNPELWRYWQPDADLVVPCRSYIFLLGQPCWDGKFHVTDSFPNLGVRPVVEQVDQPELKVSWDESFLTVRLFTEGDEKVFNWPKNISDYANL